MKSVADNPDWIRINLDAMNKELNQDHPDPAYLREKMRHIEDWIKEIEKFAYGRGISPEGFVRKKLE